MNIKINWKTFHANLNKLYLMPIIVIWTWTGLLMAWNFSDSVCAKLTMSVLCHRSINSNLI